MKVLDVAAGHGLFGIAIAQLNPRARIVALDFPSVLAVASENAVRCGVSDRYSLLPGNALQVDLGTGFDCDRSGKTIVHVVCAGHHRSEKQWTRREGKSERVAGQPTRVISL
jgi:ubiquinone/menaquinone biosynthesis C-methylase UbiE